MQILIWYLELTLFHGQKEGNAKDKFKGGQGPSFCLPRSTNLFILSIFRQALLAAMIICPHLHAVGSTISEVGIDLRSNRYINVAWNEPCLPCSESSVTSFCLIFKSTTYLYCLPTNYQNFSFFLWSPQMLATFLDVWRLSSPQWPTAVIIYLFTQVYYVLLNLSDPWVT